MADQARLRLFLEIDTAPGQVLPIGARRLRDLLRAILAGEGLTGSVSVALHVVDDATIRELNRVHRGVDRPTDVLSFPLEVVEPERPPGAAAGAGRFVLPPGMPRPLGDVVVSLPRAREQAREYGHSLEREFAYLVAHGVLHLLGHDHEQPEQQRAMREREEAALAVVGLPR